MPAPAQHIHSPANPLFKDLRRLAQDSAASRKQGRAWLEGDHLARAARARQVRPALAVFAESSWQQSAHEWAGLARQNIVLADPLFAALSALPSPARMGIVIELPLPAQPARFAPGAPTLVLDRVQDAGNTGSMLRSAAAFGFTQVLALQGTAALWGPKVVRAGMGAHFALHLFEGLQPEDIEQLAVPLLATSSHQGQWLHRTALPWPCAWLMGHEGQGVSTALARQASAHIRITQPGGEESLNVAAAAAICLHASAAGRETGE